MCSLNFPCSSSTCAVPVLPQICRSRRKAACPVPHLPTTGRWGTGHAAFLRDLQICGKTGTAQVEDEHGKFKEHIVWFVSYAPFSDPRYAVIVVVEGGSSGGGT